MRKVVLLQKICKGVPIGRFEKALKELLKGLSVELTDPSAVENGWVKILLSGEDEKVAVRFLKKAIGLAPISIENVKQFSVFSGRVIFAGQGKTEVFVDIGVLSPETIYATISLQRLQVQLVDGKKFALQRIVELFGLVDGFPLEIRVVKTDIDKLEAELTERQLKLYSYWVNMRVDRLVVLGAFRKEVEVAIKRVGLVRDLIEIETLNFSTHVIVCKLGTDAKGLVSKLGVRLPEADFVCFSPRRVLKLVDRYS